MTEKQILEAYKKISPNFVTPKVREVLVIGNRVLELSEGDILGDKVFGVTELEYTQGSGLQTTRRGQMHYTIQSARRHFNKLK